MNVEQKQKVVKIFNRLFNESNTTEMSVKRIEEISEAIDLVKNLHIPIVVQQVKKLTIPHVIGSNFRCPPSERCKNICEECALVNGIKYR